MCYRFFKVLGIAFLSIFFLYSPVAWVLDDCFENHAVSVTNQPSSDHHLSSNEFDSARGTAARLYCLDSADQVGPTEETSLTELVPLGSRNVLAKESPFPISIISSAISIETKDLWLRAPFDRLRSFSFLNDLSHPLAILRI